MVVYILPSNAKALLSYFAIRTVPTFPLFTYNVEF